MFRIFLVAIALFTISCTYYDHTFPYDFEKLEKLIEFEGQLDEISGLYYKNASTLYAIQDEEGEIFEINLESGKDKKIIDFKKEGDFEGIAKHGDYFYALESDGDIFKIKSEENVEKISFFDDDDDFEFEGLTVDQAGEKILVACKNHGKKDEDGSIFIFQFSIEQEKYLKEPYMKIEKSGIHKNFKATGISINNLGNLVLISGVSNTIVEINPQKKIIAKAQLPDLIYPQVEGICFSPEGTLFLASEKGNQDNGKIIKIKRVEK